MKILLWHVHGSWTTAFVQGSHEYVVPVVPGRTPDGLGRALTWTWPTSVREAEPGALRDEEVDLVVLQRPHEAELLETWTGLRAGIDVPAVYCEHNTPGGSVPFTRHPLAEQAVIPVVHVTHFNQLFWDCGAAPTTVVEHGIVDPGYLYTGELPRAAICVNDPLRRGRAVGADLFAPLSQAAPLDVFGLRVEGLGQALGLGAQRVRSFDDVRQHEMHAALAHRRVYVHTARWTSLGLSLLEAMQLGMPVVALATTESIRAVPPEAGILSTRVDDLVDAVAMFIEEPERASAMGQASRMVALDRYGLARFLTDWDALLSEAREQQQHH
ncbi:MAG: glycosyltransferase family 4 protein [Nocardioidaceae bacterium]|nr:glycosyltransferase family 4 protein [Nocardioidaceae bacterium]